MEEENKKERIFVLGIPEEIGVDTDQEWKDLLLYYRYSIFRREKVRDLWVEWIGNTCVYWGSDNEEKKAFAIARRYNIEAGEKANLKGLLEKLSEEGVSVEKNEKYRIPRTWTKEREMIDDAIFLKNKVVEEERERIKKQTKQEIDKICGDQVNYSSLTEGVSAAGD